MKLIKGKQYQYWYITPFNWIYDGIVSNPNIECNCCRKIRKHLHKFHSSINTSDCLYIGTGCVKNDFTLIETAYIYKFDFNLKDGAK